MELNLISLQMQLEKIRSEDVQVRWQDDDDITHCVNCKKEFTVTRRKVKTSNQIESWTLI